MKINADFANFATGRYLRHLGRRARYTDGKIAEFQIESDATTKTDEAENTQKDIRSDSEHAWFP